MTDEICTCVPVRLCVRFPQSITLLKILEPPFKYAQSAFQFKNVQVQYFKEFTLILGLKKHEDKLKQSIFDASESRWQSF